MSTLLVRNADLLAPMISREHCVRDGGLFVRDNVIEQVGRSSELPTSADHIVDARGMLVMPGLVNVHHHFYQTLTRAVPGVQDVKLFHWLRRLYPIWSHLTAEGVYVSALVAMAELMLTGCTTSVDHLYLYPNDCRIDDEIRAADEIGMRFHAGRGAMSLGERDGGLPPDRVVEDEGAILLDTQRVIETYHDSADYAMVRIVVAPCSPFSVSPALMRESASLGRAYGVRLYTHLAETLDEEQFCLREFGRRPVEYAEDLGWLGEDVWHVHCVHLNEAEVRRFADTGTGVCHCPSSNMRLGSGIAPVPAYLDARVRVGLGVDGSASNDSSHMLAEARQALLLQRVMNAPSALSAEDVLTMATQGGAALLGRTDIGVLQPGKAADFIGFRLDRVGYAGALHDPLAALVFCAPQQVDLSVINGRIVVEDGQLLTVDLGPLVERHNRLAREMVS
ncbi:MAG: 8-oxoguanine deaminase [Chloroflexi bacterium]|nr:8-oxoguanine deaminase [Chloroflexota bacterium]